MEVLERGHALKNGLALLRWVAAFLPAWVTLHAILQCRVRVPYYDSWAFVKQYQDWCEGSYSWGDFLAPHNAHPSAIGKAIYFFILRFTSGDVGLLPLVSWALSLAISLGVLALSRPLWRGHSARGAGLMFLANLSIFTAMQGHAWIWDFVFQNFIPGACLVLGLLTLSGPRITWLRWTLAGMLALISTFSFGTGFAVGFLLLPSVGMAFEGKNFSSRIPIMLSWVIGCGLVSWLALSAFGHASGGNSVTELLLRPTSSLHYILAVLGHTLGRGTAVEPVALCAAWGVVLLVVFIASAWIMLRSRDAALLRRTWPWLAFCLWAMLNAAAICVGRFHATLDTGLAHRYGTFMLFMPLGVLMLLATLVVRGGIPGWLKQMLLVSVGLLLSAQIFSWNAGWQGLEIFHRKMISRKAALDFIDALPAKPGAYWNLEMNPDVVRGARFLMAHDSLRDVQFTQNTAIASFRQGSEISSKWANWRLVLASDGGEEMRGVCGLTKEVTDMADLVLITATIPDGEEKIIALVPPKRPEDFFEHAVRRREFYDHYFGWRWPVDRELLPTGGEVTLRAYAYNEAKRKIRLIQGEARITLPKP